MSALPLINNIAIVYYDPSGFIKTIESEIEQGYKKTRLGLSKVVLLLVRYKEYEKHTNYWISEPDKGISDTFNKGAQVAMQTGLLCSMSLIISNKFKKL